jgi:hypothetical protein
VATSAIDESGRSAALPEMTALSQKRSLAPQENHKKELLPVGKALGFLNISCGADCHQTD